VVSGATIRVFGYSASWFQVPKFAVLGTEPQESIKPSRGLRWFLDAVTLLNTESNLPNTQGEAGVSLETLEGGKRTVGREGKVANE
jgi:hypothetical protein